MKLLFFSPDDSEVLQLGKELVQAGIPCEVRCGGSGATGYSNGHGPEAELWIRNDKDSHRAFLLCVQLGAGFAKRPRRRSRIECWSDLQSRHDLEEAEDYPASNPPGAGPEPAARRVNAARHHRPASARQRH
jgi:hypothetical protein